MNADAGHNLFWVRYREPEPAEVFAGGEHLTEAGFALGSVGFKKWAGHQSHVLEHPCAMPRDHRRVSDGCSANFKRLWHCAEL